MFVASGRYRTGQGLVGTKDGVNQVFHLPGVERWTQNLPYFTIAVYENGLRLALLDDYIIQESGGPGSGYNTVVLARAPYANDHLIADYITP